MTTMKIVPDLILLHMLHASTGCTLYTAGSAEGVSTLKSVNIAYPVPLGIEERSLVKTT